NTLYVADRKNDLIRALDLEGQTVKTIAGTGKPGERRHKIGPARELGMNSPWDLYLKGDVLYIAQAGFHQRWTLDLARGMGGPFAGTGMEALYDGAPEDASLAQPSGLAGDGNTVYVADSEGSVVRALTLGEKPEIKTVVGQMCGRYLFRFGDNDG